MATQAYKSEDMRQDAADAFQRASLYHAELGDIYRHFMPFRQPTAERGKTNAAGPSEGARRMAQIYDGTGPSSAFAFVANMKADWMPAFDDFFKLQNGPLYTGDDAPQRDELLQAVTKLAHALLTPVRTTADEMFLDLFAGTGAMYLGRGDKRQSIRGVAVPTTELALATGPWSEVERWFWRRPYKARHIEQIWPDGKFSEKLHAAIAQDRNGDIEVTQYTYWDARDENFKLRVWTDKDHDSEFHEETLAVTPWITPRMYVVPGEAMGRGLAHLGLPFVRTVNKARELALRAAAFALLGLWTRTNDNVFNPDTAVMAPGAMWKVAANGGPRGPSLQRLDVPHNFDISSVIIQDEREQIRRVLLDDEMPELADRVRSPTEIAGRMRRYDRNRGGATTRLAIELVTPLVQRTVDLMAQQGLLPGNLTVDQIITQAIVTAPAAASQKSARVDKLVAWLQIMTGLVGPQMMGLVGAVEKILPEIGRDMGVDEKFIRKKSEAEQLKYVIDTAVQQALEEQKQQAAPQPQALEADPAQPYLDGTMA